MKSNQNGFTLIEIAVVLLIIGLVIGGVLFGRDLVEAAQVRKQISLFQEFNTAYHGFVSKFNAIVIGGQKVWRGGARICSARLNRSWTWPAVEG